MRYLLDTHILIWALASDEKLTPDVNILINDPDSEIYYSVASVWEVEIKNRKQPERMPISGGRLIDYCDRSAMVSLPVTNRHVLTLGTLQRRESAPMHNDPFDRMILAQAKTEGMVLITHDSMFEAYQESCVMLV